jgi:hypothetical protein
MKNNEYYLKAEKLLGKMTRSKRGFKKFDVLKSLCNTCIEGQKLGYIPLPNK